MNPRSFDQMFFCCDASIVAKTLNLSVSRLPKPNEPKARVVWPSLLPVWP
jgi:hypothetical protein